MGLDRPSDKGTRVWSYVIWGLWVLAFFVLEFLGLARRGSLKSVPWFTFSETTWATERSWIGARVIVSVILLGGALDIVPHLLFGTNLWPPYTGW